MSQSFSHLSAEALLDHAEWLRGLARNLIFDEHHREEVLQQTWLRALEHPPVHDASPRGWLATVLRNLARRSAQRERRREVWEEGAARGEAVADTAEIVGRLELQQSVVSVVLTLAEPYRSAILLRYYEDLPPQAIAQRLAAPLATVKSRLQRGLAQLRERLDEDHGKDGSWRLALLPLTGAVPFGPGGAASIGASVLAGGVLVVNAKVVLGAVLVVVLAAALGLGLLQSWGELEPTPDPTLRSAEEPASEGVSILESVERTPGAGVPAPEEGASSDAERIEAPLEAGVRFVVVDEADERPVPSALVTFLDPGSLGAEGMLAIEVELASGLISMPEFLQRYGRRFRANERGELLLPPAPSGGGVVAQRDERWGFLQIEAGAPEPVRLPIGVSPVVRVRVVDGDGRPVPEVPVAIGESHGFGFRPLWAGRTAGEDGSVLAEHVHRIRPSGAERAPLVARLAFPTAEALSVPLPAPGSSTEVVLHLPPTGSIEIEVLGDDEAPVQGTTYVLLERIEEEPQDLMAAVPPQPTVVKVADGVAVFPHVALGLHLRATAVRGDLGVKPTRVEFWGPSRLGERVRQVLRFRQVEPIARFRVLDAEGEPLRSTTLRGELRLEQEGSSTSRSAIVALDSEGIARVPVTVELEPGSRRRLLVRQGISSDDGPVASLDLSLPLDEGENDLGTIRLGRDPLLVSGVVVDDQGSPIAGAEIDADLPLRRDPASPVVGWRTLGRGKSDAEGRFEVRGLHEAGEIHLRAMHPDFQAGEVLAVLAGSEGVTIALRPGGWLVGSLLLDPEVDARRLQVRAEAGSTRLPASIEDDGAFVCSGLQPGLYDLVVGRKGAREELVRVAQVRTGGRGEADERLQGLDLRGRLRLLRVRVLDAEGRALSGEFVRIDPLHGEEGSSLLEPCDREGRSLVLLRAEEEEVVLRVEGYRPERVRWTPEEQELRLREAIPVRVRLAGATPAPAAPYSLKVGFQRLEAEGERGAPAPRTGWTSLDANGVASATVPLPGRYRVSWMLERAEDAHSSTGVSLATSAWEPITVLDLVGEQEFALEVPAAEFAAAKARLEDR